jgi:hypothetical protein
MARPLSVARRIWFAYLALAALLGVGVGLFVLGVEKPAPLPPPPWSAWQPSSEGPTQRQLEIARFVGSRYHLPSGHQLVRVLVGPPTSSSQTVNEVALAKTLNPQQRSDIVDVINANETAMFILCGDQTKKCAIKEGKASKARGEVLRREALELALYTFRYIKEAKTVVTFFPPALGQSPSNVLFFDKSALDSQLKQPLHETLPGRPPVPGRQPAAERQAVDRLTSFFKYAFRTDTTGGLVLVLAPATA